MNRPQRGGGLIEVLAAQTLFAAVALALLGLQISQQRDAQQLGADYLALQLLANAVERQRLPDNGSVHSVAGDLPPFIVEIGAETGDGVSGRQRIQIRWIDRDGPQRTEIETVGRRTLWPVVDDRPIVKASSGP